MFVDYNAPGAVAALQQGDLLTFAQLYNGPANAKVYSQRIQEHLLIADR